MRESFVAGDPLRNRVFLDQPEGKGGCRRRKYRDGGADRQFD
jgi:hypothetical protein